MHDFELTALWIASRCVQSKSFVAPPIIMSWPFWVFAGHTISNITSSKFQDKPQIVSTVGLPAVSQTEQNVCDVVRAQNH